MEPLTEVIETAHQNLRALDKLKGLINNNINGIDVLIDFEAEEISVSVVVDTRLPLELGWTHSNIQHGVNKSTNLKFNFTIDIGSEIVVNIELVISLSKGSTV